MKAAEVGDFFLGCLRESACSHINLTHTHTRIYAQKPCTHFGHLVAESDNPCGCSVLSE